MERLQKRIAESGVCSRRKAEELIIAGKVKVNGVVITLLGTKVSYNDVIEVDGKIIEKEEKKYYVINKPRGVVCTASDDRGRKTILDIFEEQGYKAVYKVLNAWDYGVPQKRERLITIGIRKDLFEKCSFTFPQKHDYKPTMRDVKLDINPSKEECDRYSAYKESVFALVPPGGYWRDIDPEIAKEWDYKKNEIKQV